MTETFYAKVMMGDTLVLFRINLHNLESDYAISEENTPSNDSPIEPEHTDK